MVLPTRGLRKKNQTKGMHAKIGGDEKESMATLTIGCPTFQRRKEFKNLYNQVLVNIADRYKKDVKIVVYDNARNDEESVKEICGHERIEYYRHGLNIGAPLSILMLYTKEISDYIWFLGDDDKYSISGIYEVIDIILGSQPGSIFHIPYSYSGTDYNSFREELIDLWSQLGNERVVELDGQYLAETSCLPRSLLISSYILPAINIDKWIEKIKCNIWPHIMLFQCALMERRSVVFINIKPPIDYVESNRSLAEKPIEVETKILDIYESLYGLRQTEQNLGWGIKRYTWAYIVDFTLRYYIQMCTGRVLMKKDKRATEIGVLIECLFISIRVSRLDYIVKTIFLLVTPKPLIRLIEQCYHRAVSG